MAESLFACTAEARTATKGCRIKSNAFLTSRMAARDARSLRIGEDVADEEDDDASSGADED